VRGLIRGRAVAGGMAAAASLALLFAGGAPAGAAGIPEPAPDVPAPVISAPAELATGVPIPVTGTNALDGARITLERRAADGWTVVKSTRASAKGRFRFTYAPGVAAPSYRLRAVAQDAVGVSVTVKVRDVTFSAVGDVNLGDVPGQQIARHGVNWPWASVGAALRGADVAMANLECAISRRGAPVQKQYRFRGAPASLRAAAKVGGIDVMNLANNHIGDYGNLALRDSIGYVREYGMTPAGAGYDLNGALTPGVVTRLGLRIAVVGLNNILPYEFAASSSRAGLAWADRANVVRAVKAARKKADVVIATFHWGIELQRTENAEQRALAQVAFDAGADAVIGGHPHVLQPMRAVGAHRFVAYSLGNFVFGAASAGTTSTGILTLRLSSRGVEGHSFRRATISGGRPILR